MKEAIIPTTSIRTKARKKRSMEPTPGSWLHSRVALLYQFSSERVVVKIRFAFVARTPGNCKSSDYYIGDIDSTETEG
mgnify:CR=1 FL=1